MYKFMWERWQSEMGNDGGENTVRSQGRIQGTAKRPERNVCAVEGVEPGLCSLCSRCGDSLLADIHASQFFLWNLKRRARPRGQLRITMYHIKKYKMNYRP